MSANYREESAMATRAELQAENAALRAQLDNSTPGITTEDDVNALNEGEYTDVIDRDGRFTDSVGVTHTHSEGDTIVYDEDGNSVRVISAEDVSDTEDDSEPA